MLWGSFLRLLSWYKSILRQSAPDLRSSVMEDAEQYRKSCCPNLPPAESALREAFPRESDSKLGRNSVEQGAFGKRKSKGTEWTLL